LATAAPSAAAIELEVQYWERRAAGLSKRAEALRIKAAELLSQPQRRGEALEAEAEAELTLAEVKLCEANAQRLQDALTAMEQSATTPVPTTTTLPAPTVWTAPPAYPPADSLPTPTGPAVAGLPPSDAVPDLFPTNPPAESVPPDALDEMRQQLAELQAANRLLLERIEQLEDEHGDQPK
jgi:hypothetical protein